MRELKWKILAYTDLQHGENHMVRLSHPILIEIKIIWDSSKKISAQADAD